MTTIRATISAETLLNLTLFAKGDKRSMQNAAGVAIERYLEARRIELRAGPKQLRKGARI